MTTNLQEKFTAQIVKNFTKNRTATDNRDNAASNKNAGNAQQNARRERLFIRKNALSAIFLLRIRSRNTIMAAYGNHQKMFSAFVQSGIVLTLG
ncbi:MAG: hypothetical protein IJA81_09020 [Akkermansia sp.]|nr:hypothetical protein [Akkermansia sp.]